MKITYSKFIIKIGLYIFIILLSNSCTNKNGIEMQAETPSEIKNEWRREVDLPNDYLRLNAQIHQRNDEVFLLPGKGSYNFSIAPEIVKFDGDTWNWEMDYAGFAMAGYSAYIQQENTGYLIGGVNGSSAPTNEVQLLDFDNQTITAQTEFPFGTFPFRSSAYSNSKGYMTNSFGNPGQNNTLFTFDLNLASWDSIPSPTNINYSKSYLATSSDSLFLYLSDRADQNFFFLKEGSTEWNVLPDFPGKTRSDIIFQKYKKYIIAGFGFDDESPEIILNDLWKFDIENKTWSAVESFAGKPIHSGFSFNLNNRFYIGGGATEKLISKEVMNEEIWSISFD